MTNELLNRNVLTWLKSWDEVVFPNKPRPQLKAPGKDESKINPFTRSLMHKAPEELFNFHNKRVIMLYGPNGTGKSTMARVLAN